MSSDLLSELTLVEWEPLATSSLTMSATPTQGSTRRCLGSFHYFFDSVLNLNLKLGQVRHPVPNLSSLRVHAIFLEFVTSFIFKWAL